MAPNPTIIKAVEHLGYRVTVGDVATQAGLNVNLTETMPEPFYPSDLTTWNGKSLTSSSRWRNNAANNGMWTSDRMGNRGNA